MGSPIPRLVQSLFQATSDRIGTLSEAAPADLAMAFQLAMARYIKAGPNEGGSAHLAQLVATAEACALSGSLPLAVAAGIRSELERLEKATRAAHVWAEDAPLWWRPLPEPGPLEKLWRYIESEHRFSSGSLENGWRVQQAVLPNTFVGSIYRRLEEMYQDGDLALERAGVGAGGQTGVQRGDYVVYLSGKEANLLENAPELAVLTQWLRARAVELLGLEGIASAPQTAMLARYEGPNEGYHPHLDNPGGKHDNGRARTLVLYLNDPELPCLGGEIALWPEGHITSQLPVETVPARGGDVIFFNAATLAHGVLPLREGPARWALTLWFNRRGMDPEGLPFSPPKLTLADVILPVSQPPLPQNRLLLRNLKEGSLEPCALSRSEARRDVGIVTTVYRAQDLLQEWCRYHLDLGFAHLFIVFDHGEEPTEQALMERLRTRFPDTLVTVIDGDVWRCSEWPLVDGEDEEALRVFASGSNGLSAICARQTLNASSVLRGIQKGDVYRVDWLLHLDADERFCLSGPAHGGASVLEHFSALHQAGFHGARYLNHEHLGDGEQKARYKVNPMLAETRLGRTGWARLKSLLGLNGEKRLYFHGYHNGKAAVRVDQGLAAAGVHGWRTKVQTQIPLCAGPFILHDRFLDAGQLLRKYLHLDRNRSAPRLFPPSPLEEAAIEVIGQAANQDMTADQMSAVLTQMLTRMTAFSEKEQALLYEAGLILEL